MRWRPRPTLRQRCPRCRLSRGQCQPGTNCDRAVQGRPLPTLNGDTTPEGWDDAVYRAGGRHLILGSDEVTPVVFARRVS